MSSFQLKAEKREKFGSLEARKIKKAGKLPAVIYSKNGNINVAFDKREFEIEFKKGNIQTRIVEIELAGKKIKAIAHKIELDPVSDTVIHVDFLNCDEARKIKAQTKINFSNQDKSAGLKKGGFLSIRMRKLEVICDSEDKIPQTIDFDITNLQVGQKVRAEQIKLPAGVKFAKKDNFLIASITGRGKMEEEATTTSAIGSEGAAAGAAGTATGAAAGAAAGATTTAPTAGAAKVGGDKKGK